MRNSTGYSLALAVAAAAICLSGCRSDPYCQQAIAGLRAEKIQLEKEVLFVGALSRIEIWRPDTYEQYLQDFDESYEDVAEDFLL